MAIGINIFSFEVLCNPPNLLTLKLVKIFSMSKHLYLYFCYVVPFQLLRNGKLCIPDSYLPT